MLILFTRAIILYVLVFGILRLTGKRQLSDLQPFDLVITLLIADLAAIPVSNTNIPLLYGVVPILALFLVHQLLAFLSMKSFKIRKLVCGSPVVLMADGVIHENALKDTHYTLSDLLEQLRSRDTYDLSNVSYAILETNGELSVLLKGKYQPPTVEMFNFPEKQAVPAYVLIMDGDIYHQGLKDSGKDLDWLKRQLNIAGAEDYHKLLYASLNGENGFHLQYKQKYGGKVISRNLEE